MEGLQVGKILRKCTKCHEYTMRKETCPYCGAPTMNPRPMKFSLDDKLGTYRRRLMKQGNAAVSLDREISED
ncbi:MAG: nucleolar RNA-binding Nop10p family protein [Candidatus Helarchaeales archaeon]